MEGEMTTEKEKGSEERQYPLGNSETPDVSAQEKEIKAKKPRKRSPSQVSPSRRHALRDCCTRLPDQLDIIRRIIISVLVIGLFIFFCVFFCREFNTKTVVIEPFEVPRELQERGYTGRALVNKLLDQIEIVKEAATAPREAWELVTVGGFLDVGELLDVVEFVTVDAVPSMEVQVAGVGISLNSVKEFFGHSPTRIVGEVTLQGDQGRLYLTTRVIGKPAKTISGTLANLEPALLEAAEHIYKCTYPFVLAHYLWYLGDRQEDSLEIIQYCLRNDPPEDDHFAYALWGIILYDREDYDGAIAKYKKVIKLDPKDAWAYYNRAFAYLYLGQLDRAIEDYDEVIKLDPKYALAYYNRGIAYSDLGQLERAIEDYDKAIELNPKYAAAYYNLGLAYRDSGQPDQAIEAFQQVVELNDPELIDKAKELLSIISEM
mgnify:CR=1 FL=1